MKTEWVAYNERDELARAIKERDELRDEVYFLEAINEALTLTNEALLSIVKALKPEGVDEHSSGRH